MPGRGWLGDGLRTFPVALGVLGVGIVVDLSRDPSAVLPAPLELRALAVVMVGLLALLARGLVAHVLARRDALVDGRRPAARWTVAMYLPVAVVLAVPDLDAHALAVATGALAMTSPGVLLVVLDGSPPGRAVLRVLLAVVLVPVAVVTGYAAGLAWFFVTAFLGSYVVTILGSFGFGFLAGHLTTFVPLALVGPGGRA